MVAIKKTINFIYDICNNGTEKDKLLKKYIFTDIKNYSVTLETDILVKEIIKKAKKKGVKRINLIDPFCGSGLFTLTLYHFLIESGYSVNVVLNDYLYDTEYLKSNKTINEKDEEELLKIKSLLSSLPFVEFYCNNLNISKDHCSFDDFLKNNLKDECCNVVIFDPTISKNSSYPFIKSNIFSFPPKKIKIITQKDTKYVLRPLFDLLYDKNGHLFNENGVENLNKKAHLSDSILPQIIKFNKFITHLELYKSSLYKVDYFIDKIKTNKDFLKLFIDLTHQKTNDNKELKKMIKNMIEEELKYKDLTKMYIYTKKEKEDKDGEVLIYSFNTTSKKKEFVDTYTEGLRRIELKFEKIIDAKAKKELIKKYVIELNELIED